MKLTYIALMMTLGLLGVTGWLAWQARSDAKGVANQFDLYKKRNPERTAAQDHATEEREHQILMDLMNAGKDAAPVASAPRVSPMQPGVAPEPKETVIGPGAGKTGRQALAASGHVGPAALESQPPALSSWQRKVVGAPAIGKVTEYQKQFGFVVITAGVDKKLEKNMMFALRRGNSVIGRIKITEVEDKSAVGDLDSRSKVPGVEVEVGDEVIQDIPPEA